MGLPPLLRSVGIAIISFTVVAAAVVVCEKLESSFGPNASAAAVPPLPFRTFLYL